MSSIRDELDDIFLMVNGDTLTTLDFSDLINHHKRNGAIATVALKKRQTHIDFGVIEIDKKNGEIINYIEKPTLENLVNIGVCVLDYEVLEYIAPNEYLDFPKLIQKIIANGKTVQGYIFDGYWLDIGRPEDYEIANREIGEIYSELGIDE